MKIVLTDADTITSGDINFDIFKRFGDIEIFGLTNENQIISRIADADIVLCNKTPMTAEILSHAKKLKYIGLFATGYNNVDIDFAAKNNITVCNAPDYSSDAVAQHTFALILQLVNKTYDYCDLVQRGDWIKSQTFSFFPLPLHELSNMTIGLLGFGQIGKAVAKIANAFNMTCLYNKRTEEKSDLATFVDFDTLIKKSDIVSLHCPLNSNSLNLFNQETFSKMKSGSIFINTARGQIVDEHALKNALQSGKIAGAGLDVLREEPMNENCPLIGVKNCIITPHIAWAGLETRKRLLKIVADNLSHFLSGEPKNKIV